MLVGLVLSLCLGQSVELPKELTANTGEWLPVIPTKVDGGAPRWRFGAGLSEVDLGGLFGPDVAKQAKGRVVRASKPGVYVVEAWNAKGDVASEIAVCRVVIGTPPPTPPPDNPVDPVVPVVLTEWGKRAKAWAEAVNRPTRKAEALALAKSFRAGQSAAAAGAFADLNVMSASIRDGNRLAINEEARADWTPNFFVPLAAAMNETIKTVPQYAAVCGEVAAGLEAVK